MNRSRSLYGKLPQFSVVGPEATIVRHFSRVGAAVWRPTGNTDTSRTARVRHLSFDIIRQSSSGIGLRLPTIPHRISLGIGRSPFAGPLGWRGSLGSTQGLLLHPPTASSMHTLAILVIAGVLPRVPDCVMGPQARAADHAIGAVPDLGPRRQDDGLVLIVRVRARAASTVFHHGGHKSGGS